MGRTGQAENSQANTQMSAIQQDQVARANAAQDKYNADLKTIQGGGNIGANPFANPQYLANQNLVSASAAHATNAGEAESLDQAAQRSGENTASTPYLKAILGANRERAMTDTAAQQSADNYGKNLDWQKMLLGSDLAPTGVDTSMFSTATSGRDASLGNLTQLGLASYGPVNAAIGAAGAAVGAACPVEGSEVTLPDGSTRVVELLKAGDELLGPDGKSDVVLSIEPSRQPCVELKAQGGDVLQCSESHALIRHDGGYVLAKDAMLDTVAVEGFMAGTQIVAVEPIGIKTVYQIKLRRTHAYSAGGFWALE